MRFIHSIRCLSVVAASVLILASCNTAQNVIYLQNMQPNVSIAVQEPKPIRLEPGDKVSIIVHGRDKEVVSMFNLSNEGSSVSSNANASLYTVDDAGNIDMPILGLVNVEGMTRMDVANLIKYRLLSGKLVRDPTVTVEFANLGYYMLGETGSSRKTIDRDNITLLQAIAESGDLSITGRRDNVMVLRTEKGKQTPYVVDLRSTESVYSSPVYYLKQNDIIYVKPTDMKTDQTSPYGSSVRTPSFWVSMLSMLMTVVLLFTK